uniref:ATP synthase complex subunit 8 n=1 Tax=Pagurus nigrofascia TaxID=1929472 RepID=A0A2Z5UY84_9EUCA|nr:ATP synthase F0 subunit 8 [Pagurus nigrofascia]QCI56240.1 ATP synthase protein 8 [Pagurus nigrofascia]BBB16249.1 ATP synthase protein 8 [Pagurus nigrofascia]
MLSYFLIPQMAPLMWLNLLFMFLFVFLLFFISNYYVVLPEKMSSEKMLIKSEEKHWKW